MVVVVVVVVIIVVVVVVVAIIVVVVYVETKATMCDGLVVRFADTDGAVLGGGDDVQVDSAELGTCVFTESGLLIIDRAPRDETTRLWVADIVRLVRYAVGTGLYKHRADCACGGVDRVTVHLPRLSDNIFDEARHQRHFYSINNNGGDDDVRLIAV